MRRVVIPALIVGALTISALTSCARKVVIEYPQVPTTVTLQPTTSTTIGPDRSRETLLPTLPETSALPTTTVDFGVGTVSISGLVKGPDGPIPGATVKIERLVGDSVGERTVVADDTGRYELKNIPGGRLRLRAWKAPDLAMARNAVIFAKGAIKVDLTTEKFASTDVRWAAAPASPIEGQAVNLVLQVSRRRVDDLGVIGFELISGLAVKLVPLGALQPEGPDERLTDDSGRASFPTRCNAVGSAAITAKLASGEEANLALPPCLPIPTTTIPPTTTEVPPTTVVAGPDDQPTTTAPVTTVAP